MKKLVIGGIEIKSTRLMLPVLALAMLMALGAAQDGSGFGYPPGYTGDGSGGQGAFASDQMNNYNAPVASDAMASETFDRDHRNGDSHDGGYDGGDHQGDDHRGDNNWGDYRHGGNDWLGVGGYKYYWSSPVYYDYGWYPYYTYTYYPTYYYYTKPVVYSTYHYSPLVYNWYDPWWTSNVYGVAGKTYYTNSWTWKSHDGHHK